MMIASNRSEHITVMRDDDDDDDDDLYPPSAQAAGITVMNEVGVDPGIDHMLAMECFDEVKAHGGKVGNTDHGNTDHGNWHVGEEKHT